jgi:hypothetical protein
MNLVLLNLFVAVILQAYDDIKNRDSKDFNDSKIEKFNLIWQKYDPTASSFIKISDLRQFLNDLGEPMGFSKTIQSDDPLNLKRRLQNNFIKQLALPTYKNFQFYNYTDILAAIALRLTVREFVKSQS